MRLVRDAVRPQRSIAQSLFAAASALAFLVWPSKAWAFVNQSETFQAVTTSTPIQLDGKVRTATWQAGVTAKGFYNVTTWRPAAPDVATTAYLLYDAKYLYVAFQCIQTLAPITANQTTNGVGRNTDDQVEFNIDTSGNGSRTYKFQTTPRGVRYQESSESVRYNPIWQAAASIGKGAWSAEMAIPLQDLRGGSQVWRINFQRHIAATNEDFSWVYDPHMSDPDDSRYWPTLAGLRISTEALRPPAHADVFGLASFGYDRNEFQQTEGQFAYQKQRDYGADLTAPLTNTLAFVGTANPDFSNVELDQQTIAPQQFPRVLSEYRPFFAQGSNYLIPGAHFNLSGSPDQVFYSPSIGTFNWGGQIEGTVRSNAIGVLDVGGPGFSDQAFGFEHRSPSQDFSYFADGVLAHHTQNGSSVTACPGLLVTCRDDTYEFGLDKKSIESGWSENIVYASESGDYVSNPALAHSFVASIGPQRQYFGVDVHYFDIGPYYGPVDGFTLINDVRGPGFFSDFNGVGSSTSILKDWSGFFGADRDLDHSGHVSYAQTYADLTLNFRNYMALDMGPSISEQRTSNGYPAYTDSQTLPYNQTHVTLSYAGETASPVSVSYSWGPFATLCSVPPQETTPNPSFCGSDYNIYASFYLQQFRSSVAHQLSTRFNISAEFDGSIERPFAGPIDGQWLRRISLGENLSANSIVAVGLRSISGTGGFAEPGLNLAASFHDQFPTGDELFVAYGSPASSVTLDRLIIKFIVHIGQGGVGT